MSRARTPGLTAAPVSDPPSPTRDRPRPGGGDNPTIPRGSGSGSSGWTTGWDRPPRPRSVEVQSDHGTSTVHHGGGHRDHAVPAPVHPAGRAAAETPAARRRPACRPGCPGGRSRCPRSPSPPCSPCSAAAAPTPRPRRRPATCSSRIVTALPDFLRHAALTTAHPAATRAAPGPGGDRRRTGSRHPAPDCGFSGKLRGMSVDSPRRIVLLRHAKADWPPVPDHERPLADRGRLDAADAGRRLADDGIALDLALCSTSARTRETWKLAAHELPHRPQDRLRGAALRREPRRAARAAQRDPRRGRLAAAGRPQPRDARARRRARGQRRGRRAGPDEAGGFPTAAFAVVTFAGPGRPWSTASAG